jgi:aromatic ring hydroxylase
MSKKDDLNPDLDKAIKDALKGVGALPFEEKVKILQLAMQYEALKLKAKGDDFGKGFDKEGGDDETF